MQEQTRNYGEDLSRPMFINGYEYRYFADRRRWCVSSPAQTSLSLSAACLTT